MKSGTPKEVEIAGSALWFLVSNNQKGKLTARSAGFPACIQSAISRLMILPSGKDDSHQELIQMLEYVLQIIKN